MVGLIKVSQTPTITAGAYATGKALGGLLTFTSLADGGTSKLLTVRIIDKANQKSALDLLLFSASFTATADAATIAISAGDSVNLLGRISIASGNWTSIASGVAEATYQGFFPFPLVSSDNHIYGQLVTRGTPTYASTSDIIVQLVSEVVRSGA
jgi:hypothetical protein